MDVIKNVIITNKQFYQLTDDLYFWTRKFKMDDLHAKGGFMIPIVGDINYHNYIKVDKYITLSKNVIQLALSENNKDTVIMTEVYKTDLAVQLIDTLPITLINKIKKNNIGTITDCNIEVRFFPSHSIIEYTAWDKHDDQMSNEKVIVTIKEIKLYLFNLFYHYPDICIWDILGAPYLKQHCDQVEKSHLSIAKKRLAFWKKVN